MPRKKISEAEWAVRRELTRERRRLYNVSEKRRLARAKRKAAMTPEQLERVRLKEREADRRFRATLTKEKRRAIYLRRDKRKERARAKSWKLRNPDKLRAARKRFDEKRAMLKSASRSLNGGVKSATRFDQSVLYAEVRSVIPRGLPRHIADDVVSEIFLALMESKITRQQVAAHARQFLTSQYRMELGPREVSFDKPRFDDGDGSLHDILSDGSWESRDDDDLSDP